MFVEQSKDELEFSLIREMILLQPFHSATDIKTPPWYTTSYPLELYSDDYHEYSGVPVDEINDFYDTDYLFQIKTVMNESDINQHMYNYYYMKYIYRARAKKHHGFYLFKNTTISQDERIEIYKLMVKQLIDFVKPKIEEAITLVPMIDSLFKYIHDDWHLLRHYCTVSSWRNGCVYSYLLDNHLLHYGIGENTTPGSVVINRYQLDESVHPVFTPLFESINDCNFGRITINIENISQLGVFLENIFRNG